MSAATAAAAVLIPARAESSLAVKFALDETSIREKISHLAYAIWEVRGCPEGSAESDWLEAERQVYASVRE